MGDLETGYKFNSSESITVAKLNQMVGQAKLKPLRVAQIAGLQEALDTKATARQVDNDLAWKAVVGHVHRVDDIDGLADRLQQRSGHGHRHSASEVEKLAEEGAQKSPLAHTHPVESVSGLEAMLATNQKQLDDVATESTRISGLAGGLRLAQETALEQLSERTHGHAITEIIGLQEGLDRLSPATHMHEQVHMKGLTEALAGRADERHKHELAHVNGLLGSLNDKAAVGHTHSIFEISGTTLSGSAATYGVKDALADNDFNFRGKRHDLQEQAIPTIGAIKQIVRQMVRSENCQQHWASGGGFVTTCTRRVE